MMTTKFWFMMFLQIRTHNVHDYDDTLAHNLLDIPDRNVHGILVGDEQPAGEVHMEPAAENYRNRT